MKDKGLLLDQFLLRGINFTEQFAHSIERKQIALEGQIEKRYQAEQLREIARGKADAILIEREAEAKALQLLAEALNEKPDLLTYEYIKKLSPNISVMLVPADTPLILPLPTMGPTEPLTTTLTETPTPTPTAESGPR